MYMYIYIYIYIWGRDPLALQGTLNGALCAYVIRLRVLKIQNDETLLPIAVNS